MSELLPLEMDRGDHKTLAFTVKVDGVVVDVTGGTFRFTAKARVDDADAAAIVTATTADGKCVITDAANGKMEVRLVPSDTSALTKTTRLRYDLQLQDAASKVHTVARGPLDVIADISVTAP